MRGPGGFAGIDRGGAGVVVIEAAAHEADLIKRVHAAVNSAQFARVVGEFLVELLDAGGLVAPDGISANGEVRFE